jgi:general secretion pathway protein K
MDKQIFRQLAPHIAALPGRTPINVNTATAAVLQSLDESLTLADVESLIAEREAGGFADVESTFSSLVSPEVVASLAESTQYFQLKVVVRIDTVRMTVYSMLQRGPSGNVTPILRSFGTM